jgi:hypothetical protein
MLEIPLGPGAVGNGLTPQGSPGVFLGTLIHPRTSAEDVHGNGQMLDIVGDVFSGCAMESLRDCRPLRHMPLQFALPALSCASHLFIKVGDGSEENPREHGPDPGFSE